MANKWKMRKISKWTGAFFGPTRISQSLGPRVFLNQEAQWSFFFPLQLSSKR